MRTVAFIPVRGGSRSIPFKNIRPLAGRPLVHWTTLAALDCPAIDHVYVASDSEKIRAVAAEIESPRLSVIDRDPATATDTASTESALLEFAEKHEFDRVVLIQATSPQLDTADLTGALAELDARGADSILSVTCEHRFCWEQGEDGFARATNYDPLARPRRQDWNGQLFENGAFYATSRRALLESRCRISGSILTWTMPPETAIEIDEPDDWVKMEALLRSRDRDRGADAAARQAANIELLVTDVDGVLTDAGMYYSPEGDALKKFNTRDGMGLEVWRRNGFRTALMTSEPSPIARKRAEKLKFDHIFVGVKDKRAELAALVEREGLRLDQVAFIGDDLNDLPVLGTVGMAACPADAAGAVRAVAHYVCTRKGGEGCVRELVERLLTDKGLDPGVRYPDAPKPTPTPTPRGV